MNHRTGYLVTACVLTLTGCAQDPDTRTRQHIARGDTFVRAGKYPEASIEYRTAIQATPTSAEAHEKLASAAARAQDAPTAIGAMLRVAELKPEDTGAQLRAASLYLLAGRYENARDRATAALEADQADANAHIVLAQALAGLHDDVRSESELREAVRLAPEAPEPHVALGSAHWSAGRIADTETELRKAVAVGPQHVTANRALALFFMATQRPRDAEPLWRVVAGSPDGLPFALSDYFVAMNRLVEAERALTELVARDVNRDAARVRLAAVQYALKQRETAHQTVRAVLDATPHYVAALLLEARFFQAEHRLDEARRAAQAAVTADPASAQAALVEGDVHAALGDAASAVRAYETALKLNPSDASPALAMARMHMRDGQALEAVEAAERARTARPDDLTPRVVLIEALTSAGQRARAIEQAEEAIVRWPRVAALHAELGVLQAAEGHGDQARRTLSNALQLEPTSIPALSALTNLDVRAGRIETALTRIDNRLRQRPDDSALMLLMARTQAAALHHEQAESTLRRLVQQDPSNLDAFATLGRFYLTAGRLDDAREQFERIAPTDTNAGASTMVGMILAAQNRPEEAQRAFERALDTNPRAGVAANNLACLYQEQGRLDDALKWAMVANEQLRVPEAQDTLGWIRVQRGEYRDALAVLAASVETRPDNPLYRYHLAYAYWKNGSAKAAREEFQRALASNAAFAGRDEAKRILETLNAQAQN
jgi:tetratricopeptide (TPR) repeat protein